MKIRFLLDADVDQDIVKGIRRREPRVDFQVPHLAIPKGMIDPLVLKLAASLGRVLVSQDFKTMPSHFAGFLAQNDSPGLVIVPRQMRIAEAIEEILVIWHCSEAEEWTNCWRRLPL